MDVRPEAAWETVIHRKPGQKQRRRALRIERTARRVFDNGVGWAIESGTIRRIQSSADVAVFETRVKGEVIRVATYLHEGKYPIYLFDFDTHSGSNNNLPTHFIERAIEVARVARGCAGRYDFN